MQVSVLSKLRVTGAFVLDNNAETFPANPSIGTMAVKGDALYTYMTLLGVTNWYPLVRLPERYVHSQTSPATTWTVAHNLNKLDIWYQIQDANGQLTTPADFIEVDSNTFQVVFSEPVQGKVLVLGTGLDGETAPMIKLENIQDWPATIQPTDLAYLEGVSAPIQVQFDAAATSVQTLENKTLSDVVISGAVTEEVFDITGLTPAITPANGTIQTWTLTGNSTPTFTMADGQSLTIMINDGTNFTITWPAVSWVGGSAPTLATTGQSVIVFWKVAGVVYGSRVGDV